MIGIACSWHDTAQLAPFIAWFFPELLSECLLPKLKLWSIASSKTDLEVSDSRKKAFLRWCENRGSKGIVLIWRITKQHWAFLLVLFGSCGVKTRGGFTFIFAVFYLIGFGRLITLYIYGKVIHCSASIQARNEGLGSSSYVFSLVLNGYYSLELYVAGAWSWKSLVYCPRVLCLKLPNVADSGSKSILGWETMSPFLGEQWAALASVPLIEISRLLWRSRMIKSKAKQETDGRAKHVLKTCSFLL